VDGFYLESGIPNREPLSVKKIDYAWSSLPEWSEDFSGGYFWNFYLAPQNYHWFHAACGGMELEGRRVSGKSLPVNALGRWMSPRLYAENERLSFRWKSNSYGRVLMMCVGALGVCRIKSEMGTVIEGPWQSLRSEVKPLERLGAFELGSSVILLVEKAPKTQALPESIEVGLPLV
jgi:phosphatidylserine decarboxylase